MPQTPAEGWTSGPSTTSEGAAFSLKLHTARAHSAWERDDFASALADFEAVLEHHPDFPDIRNWAGLCRAMLGDPEGALAEFDYALTLNPGYVGAQLNRSLVLSELGRLDEASISFERLRELEAGTGDGLPADLGNRIASDHGALGDLYLEAGRPESAVEEYRKALGLRPRFADIRTRLAHAHVALGELDRALDELTLVLTERPSFLEARIRMGSVLKALGRNEEAIGEWRQCLEIDPSDRRARAYLASVGVSMEEVHVPGAEGAGGTGADLAAESTAFRGEGEV